MKTSSSSSSSSRLMSSSRSDSPFMYIFMSVTASNNYILYRIDALNSLHNKPSSSTNTRRPSYNNLRPLLVFPNPVLPEHCLCAKLGSYFYFICGQNWTPSFFGKDTFCKEFYRIRESDLTDIVPSQHNTNGGKYLRECTPMNGSKHNATVFVAKNKFYALACFRSDPQFEVFDPRPKTWKILPSQPDGHAGTVTTYVIVDRTVYFHIYQGDVLAFHLKHKKWQVLVTHQEAPRVPPFVFGFPLVATGDMAFGFGYDDFYAGYVGYVDDPQDMHYSLTISATPLPHKGSLGGKYFMLPSVHLDTKFLHDLNSSRCPNVALKVYRYFSDYMIALDGGKVFCVVSYGSGPVPKDDWRGVDPYTSYVTLSFFKVAPSRHTSCNVGKYVASGCIKPKLLHTAQFIIRTPDLRTCGRIKACFI
ncbi:hypothetical protein AgCh_005998 [Apium graveolens]